MTVRSHLYASIVAKSDEFVDKWFKEVVYCLVVRGGGGWCYPDDDDVLRPISQVFGKVETIQDK